MALVVPPGVPKSKPLPAVVKTEVWPTLKVRDRRSSEPCTGDGQGAGRSGAVSDKLRQLLPAVAQPAVASDRVDQRACETVMLPVPHSPTDTDADAYSLTCAAVLLS